MINQALGRIYNKTSGSNRLERIWKLAQVDFKKRYYNDKLGILWTILNPLFQISIFYFVFNVIREHKEENFVLFLYLGIISFSTFTSAARRGLNIINQKRYLLENIQFKKLDIFISAFATSLMTGTIDFIIYSIVAYLIGISFTIHAILILFLLTQLCLTGIGVAMILAFLKFHMNDIKNIWQLLNFGLFWISGIFFSGELILVDFPPLKYLNPLLCQIINIRHVFLEGVTVNLHYLILNLVQCFVIFSLGVFLMEKSWHLVSEKL